MARPLIASSPPPPRGDLVSNLLTINTVVYIPLLGDTMFHICSTTYTVHSLGIMVMCKRNLKK
jgi:hypothetical protein